MVHVERAVEEDKGDLAFLDTVRVRDTSENEPKNKGTYRVCKRECMGGLLIVMTKVWRVSARNHGRLLRTHLSVVSMNISSSTSRVSASVSGRVANCIRCTRVAAIALLTVLWIRRVVQRVSVFINGTWWNSGKRWWRRRSLILAYFAG